MNDATPTRDEPLRRVAGDEPTIQPTKPRAAPPALIPPGCERIRPEMLPLVELTQAQIDGIVRRVPGGARNVEDIYPLAPLQEGMLFHRLMTQRGDGYVLSLLFELRSDAALGAFIEALQAVVDGHGALRSAVFWDKLPRPVQVVCRKAALSVTDVKADPGRKPMEQLNEWLRPDRSAIDLNQAPLVAVQVLHGGSGICHAVLRVHHLICDHQALSLLVNETLAYLQGRGRDLPAPVPYREFVAHALADAKIEEAERFFRDKLRDVDESCAPFGLVNVIGDGRVMREAHLEVERGSSMHARAQAKRFGVGIARIFHAACALVVAHTTGRDDIVFGTVVRTAQQRGAQARRMLGMSVNTLPLRLRLADASAVELLLQTDCELSELLEFEQAPLTVTQRCSAIAGGAPLFTTLFNYRRAASLAAGEDSSSAGIRAVARGEAWTNYPLTLIVDDLGDAFRFTVQTDPLLDPNRVAAYLHTALRSLVEALAHAPDTPALTLDVLPESERRQVIAQFNATDAPFPREKLIHQLFEEQVTRGPDAVAVVYEGQSLTYGQLNSRANQLARYLRDMGIGPDQMVAICMERSLEMVVGLLGILKAGGAYVPLDPDYPIERIEHMLSDSAPGILLTQQVLTERFARVSIRLIALDGDWPEIATRGTSNLDPADLGLCPCHLAYVIYTSGSTGQPKGAMNEHRAVVNRLVWMQSQYGLDGSGRVLQKTPFSFDVSVWEFFWTLMSGARLIMARPRGHQDPAYLMELIEATAITTLHFVPSMLQMFLERHTAGSCKSISHIVCSGEELTPALKERCLERLPQARLSNLYGPTEAAIDVTSWECVPDQSERRVPIGRPIANLRVYVLDRYRRPTGIGVVGEIYLGGEGVGRGYMNRSQLTADRFVLDPFSDAPPLARMYKTGDLGRWREDGAVEYLGRNDHQVKIRGLRIELGEIEAQLQRHDQIKEAAVVAYDDCKGGKRLAAYIVPLGPRNSESQPSVHALRAHLKSVLPEHMVPSAFVALESLPLSSNGKLDRKALPPPPQSAYASREYHAPQGGTERMLTDFWQELLQVGRVGREDDFFELGGHSLLAMQLLARIQATLSIELPLRALFDFPTVRELSQRLDELRRIRLQDSIGRDRAEAEELLEMLASMPENEAEDLLRKLG